MINETDTKKMSGKNESLPNVSEEELLLKTSETFPLNYLSRINEDIHPSHKEIKDMGNLLVKVLKGFELKTEIVGVHQGPTITAYDLKPKTVVRVSLITELADDIAFYLGVRGGIKVTVPVPYEKVIRIEIPNKARNYVALRDVLESAEYKSSKATLPSALGKNMVGENVVLDLAEMPHILMAGSAGSGKSICLHSMLMSMMYRLTSDDLSLIIIDPKTVEFGRYNGIPHLLTQVIAEPNKAKEALEWAVDEAMQRYKTIRDYTLVSDIDSFNKIVESGFKGIDKEQFRDLPTEKLPRIVIVIDELSDLMTPGHEEAEDLICKLAQIGRPVGIHLIIATQNPSDEVITGVIKANISSRIALSVSSQIDSRTIIDQGGAEKLLGRGDMLFFPGNFPKPVRVQGCYISGNELDRVLEYIKKNSYAEYDKKISYELPRHAKRVFLGIARIGITHGYEIFVVTDDPDIVPNFHIRDYATGGKEFHTAVRIECAEYACLTDKDDILSEEQKKIIVDFLRSGHKHMEEENNWDWILEAWNRNNEDIKVSRDQEMPDYSKLKQ